MHIVSLPSLVSPIVDDLPHFDPIHGLVILILRYLGIFFFHLVLLIFPYLEGLVIIHFSGDGLRLRPL